VVFAGYNRQTGGWDSNAECFLQSTATKALNARAVLDAAGAVWRGRSIADPDALRPTALMSIVEMSALTAVIAEQQVGRDDVADLILANLKAIDYVGHQYGPDSAEIVDALETQDRELGRLLTALDAALGRDRYVVVITADHGMPAESAGEGPRRVINDDLVAALHARFDPDRKALIAYYEPENSQIFVDPARLEALELTLTDLQRELQKLPYMFAAYTEDEGRRAAAVLK
jgi:predicted AlkP superfamily pyrophosphatase or phosphodiesterase